MRAKVAKIIVFTVIMIVALFGTVNILKNKVLAVEGENSSKNNNLVANIGERVEGEPNPDE